MLRGGRGRRGGAILILGKAGSDRRCGSEAVVDLATKALKLNVPIYLKVLSSLPSIIKRLVTKSQ